MTIQQAVQIVKYHLEAQPYIPDNPRELAEAFGLICRQARSCCSCTIGRCDCPCHVPPTPIAGLVRVNGVLRCEECHSDLSVVPHRIVNNALVCPED